MEESLLKETKLLNKLKVREKLYNLFSERFPNSKITINFMDWNDSYGRRKQKADIDYEVIVDEEKCFGVSVKTRDNEFNFTDIPIEIYSSYNYDNNSSMAITEPGSELKSNAEIFFYINRIKHLIIDNSSLRHFIQQLTTYNSDNLLKNNLLDIPYRTSYTDCQLSENEYILKYPVNGGFKDVPVKFMKSENKRGNNTWTTISICVKLKTLNELQIPYK